MKFASELLEARLIKRYKRFLLDVELADGSILTAHTANTGAMTGCAEAGSRVWLSHHANPKRKYAYSWELVEVENSGKQYLVGINTLLSNVLVKEALENHLIPELNTYQRIQTERPYGRERSRIDLLLSQPLGDNVPDCYVEVKNVTLVEGEVAYFPDAVSLRAIKHLRELQDVVQQGQRAVIFFCVQREDVQEVRPATQVDPNYTQALQEAMRQGVEVLAYRATVSTSQIALHTALPVRVDDRQRR